MSGPIDDVTGPRPTAEATQPFGHGLESLESEQTDRYFHELRNEWYAIKLATHNMKAISQNTGVPLQPDVQTLLSMIDSFGKTLPVLIELAERPRLEAKDTSESRAKNN